MANALYAKAKEAFLSGTINLVSDTIKVALVDAAEYTPNLTTDDFFDDVPTLGVVATATLTGKSVTNGVFDAADATFTAASGDQSEYLVIYKDTGTPATSPLIALIDTATGLAITPNGDDILVTWDDGANKIFAL